MKKPPEISISRLSLYLRFLDDYLRQKGLNATISSEELAQQLDLNPHQIRKDLSYFGKFGSPGVGYRAQELKSRVSEILGLRRKWNLCICGSGNLGAALAAYEGFKKMNLHIVALFDNDPLKIGKKFQGIDVYSTKGMASVLAWLKVDIAIIAVPQEAAQALADKLADAGVKAILNFAPVSLSSSKEIKIRNMDVAAELLNLTYFLSTAR
ncbi:MAG: redox-sensing transcriptional repressor Rex [Candidatus Omnitrophica bacterium]|nr:redox-sensing transcriptional repressor Rex [Candidatus Omnitrophota bacterium]